MLKKILFDSYDNIYFFDEKGDFHRLDGPAVEYADGLKAWFINGKQYTEEEFNEIVGELC